MSDSLLRMGTIGRPHGIKGEISIDWEGEYVPRVDDIIYIRTEAGNKPSPFRIAGTRKNNSRFLLRLDGINDRNAAEKLKGQSIYLPKSALPALEEGEAFLADLPGCEVFLTDGGYVGILSQIEFPANQIIWIINDPDGNEILFPARPEFIEAIEPGKKRIVINPPPGLLEIYRA